jgi:hypothetical protein
MTDNSSSLKKMPPAVKILCGICSLKLVISIAMIVYVMYLGNVDNLSEFQKGFLSKISSNPDQLSQYDAGRYIGSSIIGMIDEMLYLGFVLLRWRSAVLGLLAIDYFFSFVNPWSLVWPIVFTILLLRPSTKQYFAKTAGEDVDAVA